MYCLSTTQVMLVRHKKTGSIYALKVRSVRDSILVIDLPIGSQQRTNCCEKAS